MFTCDICQNDFETENCLLINFSVVLACEKYLDYLSNYWSENGVIPEGALKGQSKKAIREMTRESIRQDAGNEPWLVCERCTGKFFKKCLTVEAREQALAYIGGSDEPGFYGKGGTPLEKSREKPVSDGPKLLDEAPARSIDFRDGEKPSGPGLDEELEKLAKTAAGKKEIIDESPPKDEHPSAADILQSLGEGTLPPPPETEDEFADLGSASDAASDEDLADLGLPESDLKLDENLEEVSDIDEAPGSHGKDRFEDVLTNGPAAGASAPQPANIPPGHMAVACVCGKQMFVPETYSGRRFRCKSCGATVVIGGHEKDSRASEILPLAVEAVGAGDLNSAIRHIIEALKVAPDDEEVRDFAAMTLFQATQKSEKLDEELLNDHRLDRFFCECKACGKTWVPNPIASTGDPTKDGGVCVKCAHAYCRQCAQEGGAVCRACGQALVAAESATGRTSKSPVEINGLNKVLLLHESSMFAQSDLNRILAEFRPELKIRGIKFALFPMRDWPDDIGQLVAVLATKHAKGSDIARLRHEVVTDPGTENRLCLVYCYA